MLKLCKINACPNGTLGIHLSRAPYDPYPWVSGVLENSSAYQSGIRISDTVLECNGTDVLGWKISELAVKIRNHWDCGGKTVSFLIWRNKTEGNVTTPAINQQSLQKFATCLQNIAQLLECPICLEVIKPPGWQCCNGHVLCNSCRNRSVKCPVCRVPFGPRGRCLLSDKLFTLLAETFPCDGSRNGGNKNGRCPQDNHKIKKTNNISKKSTSAAIQQSSSSIQQSSQHIQQNIDIRNQPATISLPRPTTISSTLSLTQHQNTNSDNETAASPLTIIPDTTTTRVITVGEETRTSPVKIRNNRNLSNLIIPTTVPISQDEPLVTTTTATIIETPTIESNQQQQQQQQLSTVSKNIISVPTTTAITTDNRTLLNNTITSTSTVASLQSIIATDTATTTEQQLNSEKNFIPYMSSTILNPNTNSCDSDITKNIKQIITLKVKSKSSENLEFLLKKNLNDENIESDKNELQQRPQALSLPTSPVSNLVSLKKNHKKMMSTTTKITSGYEISLEAASQRNHKISSKTSVLNEKSDTKTSTTVCPSDTLLSNLMLVYKNYHCPTGKSTCIIEEFDEIFPSSLPSFITSTKFQHQFHLPTQSTTKSTLNTTLYRRAAMKDDKNYLCNESHCCCCCYSCCAQYENKMNPNYKREVIENIQRDQLNLHLERSSKELCKNLNIKTDINNNCCNSKKISCCNNVNDVMNDDFSQNGKTNDKNDDDDDDDDEIIKTITSTSASKSALKSYQKTNSNENHHQCFNLNVVEKIDDIKEEDIKLQVHMKLLNHLRRNHKIPLCQYHCGLNEKIPIDNNMMMKKNNKSNILMCISIDDNETEENAILPILESPTNFISLPCTTASLKTPKVDARNYISSFGNSYSNCSSYINQSSFSSIPSTIIPVITHTNKDDHNKIFERQSEITESKSLLSSSPSLSNIIMNNSNKIIENPIQMMATTSSKTIETKPKNSTSSTVNILKEIKNSLTHLDSQQIPPQTNEISSENINKLQNSIKNSTENSNGIFHFNNHCSIITSTSSNNHQQHHLHYHQYPQPYRQVYKKRSFESCSDLNSKKLISELNSKNLIEDASRSKLSTTATTKTTTTTTTTTDKTSSQLPIHYNKKILKSFPTTTCTIGTVAAVDCCKSYFATKLNTNQKIPNSNEYKISIECIEKIRFKTELFFIIKIPLKNYKEMNFCSKCNTINKNNNNNNNNKNCKNIEKKFLSKKYSNGMDSGEQINIIDKENKIISSVDNNNISNKYNNNNKNDINNNGLQQLKTERQHPKDVQHVLHDLKINQNNNLINSQILEQPPTTFSTDSTKFCHNQHHYHNVYNFHHHNSVQQSHPLECNQNNIIDKKNFTAIEKRAAHLKGEAVVASLNNENNKFCCNNCKSPTRRTSILNSSKTNSNTTQNPPQSLNDVTYCCCKCNCNSSNNCNINISNKKCCNNVEYKNLRKKSAIFIWYCGSDYELNVKNFRAVIECCNIIKKRDNDSNDIMNINTNIINKNNINNDNDDDDDNKVLDNDDRKNQKLFWNSNNKINIVTNKNLNNANKCIHEENIKDVKSSTINSSNFSTLSSKSILPILPISSSSSSSLSNYNMNNKKIALWIHPMTKSWNCIRDHMEFHLLDEDTNDDLNDSNDDDNDANDDLY